MSIQNRFNKPVGWYVSEVDELTCEQFGSALAQEYVVAGALMPDAHAGYALPIGAVMATRDQVVPAWVGYDIGCGVLAVPTSFLLSSLRDHAEEIFRQINRQIPVGSAHRSVPFRWQPEKKPASAFAQKLHTERAGLQLGTLGSGNHFLELGYDEDQRVWIVVHSGSRGIGHDIAAWHMKRASGGRQVEGHFPFAARSAEGGEYLQDMAYCEAFALENRRLLARETGAVCQSFLDGAIDWGGLINRNHNHVEQRQGLYLHRKGATQAEAGMLGVIPGNMRSGSFVVRGKGVAEALWSSSHGAGRRMSRTAARRSIALKDFQSDLAGIVAKADRTTLDEAPAAYKDIEEVLRLQADMVEVIHHIRPVVNIKG